jgi:hypothetical protein
MNSRRPRNCLILNQVRVVTVWSSEYASQPATLPHCHSATLTAHDIYSLHIAERFESLLTVTYGDARDLMEVMVLVPYLQSNILLYFVVMYKHNNYDNKLPQYDMFRTV